MQIGKESCSRPLRIAVHIRISKDILVSTSLPIRSFEHVLVSEKFLSCRPFYFSNFHFALSSFFIFQMFLWTPVVPEFVQEVWQHVQVLWTVSIIRSTLSLVGSKWCIFGRQRYCSSRPTQRGESGTRQCTEIQVGTLRWWRCYRFSGRWFLYKHYICAFYRITNLWGFFGFSERVQHSTLTTDSCCFLLVPALVKKLPE